MNSYLQPASLTTMLDNLDQAMNDVGSGGGTGATFLRVDDRTGAVTFGKERAPLPPDHKFVVGLHSFAHGYIDLGSGVRVMATMGTQPARPMPPGDKYGSYESGGPRNATEITLNSIDEPGFNLVFTALNQSNANVLRNFLAEVLIHSKEPAGAAGYVHPVIVVRSASYLSKAHTKPDGTVVPSRTVHTFGYVVRDWMHVGSQSLLSQHGGALEAAKPAQKASWEDDEDDMSKQEREFLGAAV